MPEFVFNRRLGSDIQRQLRSRLFKTLQINADGRFPKLTGRVQQTIETDLFLSMHHDSVQLRYLSRWSHAGAKRTYSDRFSGFTH